MQSLYKLYQPYKEFFHFNCVPPAIDILEEMLYLYNSESLQITLLPQETSTKWALNNPHIHHQY